MTTITRQTFIAAVEAGIENTNGDLSAHQVEDLRRVAAATKKAAYGAFQFRGCGCPATQAGLSFGFGSSHDPGTAEFAVGYDSWLIDAHVTLGGMGILAVL